MVTNMRGIEKVSNGLLNGVDKTLLIVTPDRDCKNLNIKMQPMTPVMTMGSMRAASLDMNQKLSTITPNSTVGFTI
jgi:hypothetical protein